MRTALVSALLVLASCGGEDVVPPPSRCNFTLSGAVTATVPCVAVAIHDGPTNRTGFSLAAIDGAPTLTFLQFELDLGPGDLQPGTYGPAFAGAAKTAVATTSDAWLEAAHAPPGADQGSYTLQITSASPQLETSTGLYQAPTGRKDWTVRGTLDATAPPVNGAGAPVVVHASF